MKLNETQYFIDSEKRTKIKVNCSYKCKEKNERRKNTRKAEAEERAMEDGEEGNTSAQDGCQPLESEGKHTSGALIRFLPGGAAEE